tara:strand:+ start:3466 stop:4980 length:1515 start_codon:yes stop_codon:yes gene_type:complete
MFIVFIYFSLLLDNSFAETKSLENSSLQINLVDELKKGNLFIGLRQYLGSKNVKESRRKSLVFESDNTFLNLTSENGIMYKSKKFAIVWKTIPRQIPLIIERQVLGPFASFESAKKQSNILKLVGLNPIIVNPDQWELWLPKEVSLAKQYKFKPQKIVYKSEVIPYLMSEFTNQRLEGIISISSGENITINNIPYGKTFYLVKDSYGTWSLIQKLTFDKYLEGVLPHEIGANSPVEALKAQAIIARTWAFYNADRFKNDKFHLCITTQCQVYKPTLKSNTSIIKAIRGTTGSILTFNKKPINAFYHASNGGVMALSGESWQMNNYPYFQSKFDVINSEINGMSLPFSNEFQIEKFISNKKISFLGDNHYLFRWEKRISAEKINDLLIKNELINKGRKITGIKVIERGISGRVTKLALYIKNESQPVLLIKDNIRRYLKFLPSNLFIIDKLNDNFWIFKGGGFGHGVGLSQSGAIEMANLGFNFKDILNHYYSKSEIKNIKALSE